MLMSAHGAAAAVQEVPTPIADARIVAVAEIPHPQELVARMRSVLTVSGAPSAPSAPSSAPAMPEAHWLAAIANATGSIDPRAGLMLALVRADGQATPGILVSVDIGDAGTIAAGAKFGLVGQLQGHGVLLATDAATLALGVSAATALAPEPLPDGVSARLRADCGRAWLLLGESLRQQEWVAEEQLRLLHRPPGAPDLVPVAQAAMLVSLAIAQDIHDIRLDLGWDEDRVACWLACDAKGGTPLAAALAPQAVPRRDIAALLGSGESVCELRGCIDVERTKALADELIPRVALQLGVASDPARVVEWDSAFAGLDGSFAMRIDTDREHGLRWLDGMGVAPSVDPSQAMERLLGQWAAEGSGARAAAALGVPLWLTWRAAPPGLAWQLHRGGPPLPPAQEAALRLIARDGYAGARGSALACGLDAEAVAACLTRGEGPLPQRPAVGPETTIAGSMDLVALLRASLAGSPGLPAWIRAALAADPAEGAQRIRVALRARAGWADASIQLPNAQLRAAAAALALRDRP